MSNESKKKSGLMEVETMLPGLRHPACVWVISLSLLVAMAGSYFTWVRTKYQEQARAVHVLERLGAVEAGATAELLGQRLVRLGDDAVLDVFLAAAQEVAD